MGASGLKPLLLSRFVSVYKACISPPGCHSDTERPWWESNFSFSVGTHGSGHSSDLTTQEYAKRETRSSRITIT